MLLLTFLETCILDWGWHFVISADEQNSSDEEFEVKAEPRFFNDVNRAQAELSC